MTHKIKRILSNFGKLLTYLPRVFELIWVSSRVWTLVWLFLLIFQGLLPVAAVYVTKYFINHLVVTLHSKGDWNLPLIFAVVLACLVLLTEICRSLIAWIQNTQAEIVRGHIYSLIHQKSISIDLAFYDSADFYDHLHRAREQASYRSVALLESIGSLFQNTLTLMAMSAVLIPFGLWLPVALLVSTLPAFWVVLRASLDEHEWSMRMTTEERRRWYYDWLMTSAESASELRLFGLGRYFKECDKKIREGLRNGYLKLVKNQTVAELKAGITGFFVMTAVMLWMLWRSFLGFFTLGDLALLYQAFNQGQGLMRSLLQNVGKIYANSLFLGNLFEFLDLKPKVLDPADPRPAPLSLKEGIRFCQMTFSYSITEAPALKAFDLFVPAGQTVAIVGSNGAGKSTLIKLLCRLYDPQSGKIEFDGVDIREMNLDDLRRRITVLFQQPVHYNTTVQENIGLGNLEILSQKEQIESAAQAAAADQMISGFPERYATILGNAFVGGKELSVGQWQRIALARAFLRQAPIMLLDEPTSAMDSWAETNWLECFQSLSQGRTVIVITHRFTTAMRADMIHVMEAGQIVESGSHDELLARQGLYAQSWQAQMKQGVPEYR